MWSTRRRVLTSCLAICCALVTRVRWQMEKGNLHVQWNQPWPRVRPFRHSVGDIIPMGVVGSEMVCGVCQVGRRLLGGVPARQGVWDPDEGGSTVAVRDGEAQDRTGGVALLLLQQPFLTSRSRPLAVSSPWHVDSGTRSSPVARKEEK